MKNLLTFSFDGAWYYIMNKGATRRAIFNNDSDKELFINSLAEMCNKFHIEVHAYCLLDNQYQLLVRAPDANIAKAMHFLETVYSIKLNNVSGCSGPTFRGRYHCVLVEQGTYLLHLSKLIHLAPVENQLVLMPEYYKWSSYCAYLGEVDSQSWIYTSKLISMLSTKADGIACYRSFLDGVDDIDLRGTNHSECELAYPQILGSCSFVKEVKEKASLEEESLDFVQC